MSNYRWRDLLQLNSSSESYLSPLACIAHIDANAFFAQVEQVRCGYTKDDPVVCVQWKSIIAVSYAARKYGISRMDSIDDAMKKCDNLVPIHTAVFKKGEDFWRYYDGYGSWNSDKSKTLDPSMYKVALDPYRRESRKMFKIFKKYCTQVEKASVDEVFMDLGSLCFEKLLLGTSEDQYETEDGEISPLDFDINLNGCLDRLRDTFIGGTYDLDSYLPAIPEELKTLKFEGDVFNPRNNPLIEDWDDVILLVGSHITQRIRSLIVETLGYTTSCGLSRTKVTSKLGSNFKKPNAQTIILNKNIVDFLDCGSFEITSFWTLGGNLGHSICKLLDAPETGTIKFIRETWHVGPDELKKYLDDKVRQLTQGETIHGVDPTRTGALAEKLFEICRGEYSLPVNSKPVVKSMMSNKIMRGDSCSNLIDCLSWLEVFSAELSSRVRELEQEYNKVVVPKTVTISVKTKNYEVHRKSGQVTPRESHVSAKELLRVASVLVKELHDRYSRIKNAQYYPLVNLNMVISNFSILEVSRTVIDMFGSPVVQLKSVDSHSHMQSEKLKDTPGNAVDAFTPEYGCDICHIHFNTERDFKEHKDYHYALRVSESLNGVKVDSKNLSIGERRLMFGKRKRSPIAAPANTTKRGKKTQKDYPNILKYFAK